MKRTVVLFLACVMTLSLFGCEKDTEAPGSSTVPTGSVSPTEVVTASPEASTPAGTTATETETTGTPPATKTPAPTQTATATPEPEKKLKTLDYQLYTGCFDGVLIVKNGANKLGLIDESGKLLVDYQYSSGLISVGGYTVFDKKYVYDKTGKLVYEDANETIEHCGNGILLLTETGNWKSDSYEEAKQNGASEEELAQYYTWTTRNVYKKLDGTEILSVFGSGRCGQFNKQGYTWVERQSEGYSGPGYTIEIINLNGEVVRRYSTNGNQVEGYSLWIIGEDGFLLTDDVVTMGGYNFINIDSEMAAVNIEEAAWAEGLEELPWYSFAVCTLNAAVDNSYYCFSSNSLSAVKVGNSYYLYDIEQNTFIAKYADIEITASSKYILVQNSEGKWGYIDKNGKEYRFYDDATSFDDGYAMVKIDGLLYVINENFEIVSEGFEGDSASSWMNKFFYIEKGNEVIFVKFHP